MSDLIRILLLLALSGAALTALGSGVAWWRDEGRQLRRMLGKALGAPPELVIIARDRGLAAGLNLDRGNIAVLWDDGMKGLVYRLEQLVGAELIVDDQVAARAFRGELRRPLDQLPSEAKRILLRLVFDNARDPDFELPLWPPVDQARIQPVTAFDALQGARRWVSSVEAVLRKTAPLQVEARPTPPVPAEPLPLFAAAESEDQTDEDDLPWDEDDEDQGPGGGVS